MCLSKACVELKLPSENPCCSCPTFFTLKLALPVVIGLQAGHLHTPCKEGDSLRAS